jgi:hypothetical protein
MVWQCTQPYRASRLRPEVELRRAGQRSAMALSAGRLDVARRQDRLLPCQRAAVGFLDRGCRALPAVTHHAAELIERVWDYRDVANGCDADIGQDWLLSSPTWQVVQRSTTPSCGSQICWIRRRESGAAMSPRLRGSNQRQILILVVTPFTEMILGRGNGQQINNSRLTTPKARTGWPNNVCHNDVCFWR